MERKKWLALHFHWSYITWITTWVVIFSNVSHFYISGEYQAFRQLMLFAVLSRFWFLTLFNIFKWNVYRQIYRFGIYFRILHCANKCLFYSNLFTYHPMIFSLLRNIYFSGSLSLWILESFDQWEVEVERKVEKMGKARVHHFKSLGPLYLSGYVRPLFLQA